MRFICTFVQYIYNILKFQFGEREKKPTPGDDRVDEAGNVGPDDGVLAVPDQQVDRGHRLANAHVLSHHVQRQNRVRPEDIDND